MAKNGAAVSPRVKLDLTKDEFETMMALAARFGTSYATITRALVKEGLRRVEKMGTFSVEIVEQS